MDIVLMHVLQLDLYSNEYYLPENIRETFILYI